MIERFIIQQIAQKLGDNKVIVLIGPRQVGKTTLLKNHFVDDKTLYLNGDDADVRLQLSNPSSTYLKQIIGKKTRLIIDEAQRIKNIGLTLKILHDELPQVKIIATGSSAFELSNKMNEPLTGRKWEFKMWPISMPEMIEHKSLLEESRLLEHRLVYGWYPDVINNPGDEIDFIEDYAGIIHAYEFKWNPKSEAKFSKSFTRAYENHQLMTVNKNNYLGFIHND